MKTEAVKPLQLPPLILHPFSNTEQNSVLAESSRASLALQGFPPRDQTPLQELDKQLLRGRNAELRMLFYIGKDICRWADQCTETAQAAGWTTNRRIRPETFGILLIELIPQHVRAKLEGWGVLDFCALFRRSFGLHAIFQELPEFNLLSAEFLRRYHRYLDQWYEQRSKDSGAHHPGANEFTFDLYASGEYTSMLEKSWEEDHTSHA
jgi:hypothetical protein